MTATDKPNRASGSRSPDDESGAYVIRRCEGDEVETIADDLAAILIDVVENGASVGFMSPLSFEKARKFWIDAAASIACGDRILLVAEAGPRIVGTVQVVLAVPENQPHRGEIAKLQVLRAMRRKGIASALMAEAEARAKAAEKSLLMLDTTTGEAAERLYLALGWTRFGIMPGHALFPDGRISDTSFFYKNLGGP